MEITIESNNPEDTLKKLWDKAMVIIHIDGSDYPIILKHNNKYLTVYPDTTYEDIKKGETNE